MPVNVCMSACGAAISCLSILGIDHRVNTRNGFLFRGELSKTYETYVKSIMLLMVIWALHGLWEGLDSGLRLPS